MTEVLPLGTQAEYPSRRDWLALGADYGALDILQPPPIAASADFAGKAIVICCDGTSNEPTETDDGIAAPTNVYRLYQALTHETRCGGRQITWYDAGVGTGTSTASKVVTWLSSGFDFLRKFVPGWLSDLVPDSVGNVAGRVVKAMEAATGIWIEENIEQGYREIVRNYEPGDRIFIFGFSRGAYTARCIAGVIARCGLLRSENIRYVPDVMKLYRRRKDDDAGGTGPILADLLIHPAGSVKVHVLGLYDTVAALGLPLWGWWFRIGALWRNKTLDSNPADICEHVYHVLSMDERRSQFFPTMTTPKRDPETGKFPPTQTIRQIWLRGAHADIGGGYASRSLGDIGLEWMLQLAQHHGLRLRRDIDDIPFHHASDQPICRQADPLGRQHNEMDRQAAWIILGAWPRWAPVPRPAWIDTFQERVTEVFGAPHDLVYRRAALAAAAWLKRPAAQPLPVPKIDKLLAQDGLIYLGIGDKIRVDVAAATIWNRTAIVFETAASYRITYLATPLSPTTTTISATSPQDWRDAEEPRCGPAGQKSSWADLPRHLFRRSRRLPQADWLELIGHIAHPRPWPVAEFGLRRLLTLLFWRDPKPLTMSLIRLGKYLPQPGASVDVINLASGGLFYAFANDVWPYYGNNSGAVSLQIERVAEVPADGPFFIVTPRGEVLEQGRVERNPLGAIVKGELDSVCAEARKFVVRRNASLLTHAGTRATASWPLPRFNPSLAGNPASGSPAANASGAMTAIPAYPVAASVYADLQSRDRATPARRRFALPKPVENIDRDMIAWWKALSDADETRQAGGIDFKAGIGETGLGHFGDLAKSLTSRAPVAMQPAAKALEVAAKAVDMVAAVATRPTRRKKAKAAGAWAHGWDRADV